MTAEQAEYAEIKLTVRGGLVIELSSPFDICFDLSAFREDFGFPVRVFRVFRGWVSALLPAVIYFAALPDSMRPMLAALACTLLFSISVICGHRSAKMIGGTEANFWRLTCAGVFLGAWAFGAGMGISGVAFPMFLLSGLSGIGIGDVAFFQALPRLGSRLSLVLVECLAPPFGALIEWLWLGTTLTPRQIGWGVVILAGVVLALTPGAHLKQNRRGAILGTVFAVVAALGTAGGAVLSRKAYALVHECGERIDGGSAAFQRVLGGLVLAGVALLVVRRHALKLPSRQTVFEELSTSRDKWRRVWPWIVANSLAGQTLGVSCMQLALERTPTGIVLAIIAMTPIVVIPLAFVFEHERPSLRSLGGGVVAVGGVIGLVLAGR